MNTLNHVNLALQFARSFLNIAAIVVSDDHVLRQTNRMFGMSQLDVLLFPTLFFPTFILLYFGYYKLNHCTAMTGVLSNLLIDPLACCMLFTEPT
mmetsp:Transcript_25623/g.43181  ORF Transcript_25623/g.43181 Transcript_25623/m.43181 type:complete len:95 (+) Transcript_25623:84-368(+)